MALSLLPIDATFMSPCAVQYMERSVSPKIHENWTHGGIHLKIASKSLILMNFVRGLTKTSSERMHNKGEIIYLKLDVEVDATDVVAKQDTKLDLKVDAKIYAIVNASIDAK